LKEGFWRGGEEEDKGRTRAREYKSKGEDPSRASKAWSSGGRLIALWWATH